MAASNEELTTVQKATHAQKASQSTDVRPGGYGTEEKVGVTNDEFDGDVRYEGSILVERKVGDEWVTVMTDKPRPGDKVQQTVYDVEEGEFKSSSDSTTKPGAARMPGKS